MCSSYLSRFSFLFIVSFGFIVFIVLYLWISEDTAFTRATAYNGSCAIVVFHSSPSLFSGCVQDAQLFTWILECNPDGGVSINSCSRYLSLRFRSFGLPCFERLVISQNALLLFLYHFRKSSISFIVLYYFNPCACV